MEGVEEADDEEEEFPVFTEHTIIAFSQVASAYSIFKQLKIKSTIFKYIIFIKKDW